MCCLLLIRYAAENGVACWKESGHIGTAELWDDQLVIDGYRVTEDTALITVTWDAEFEQYRYTTVAHVEALPKNPAPESAQYFFAADRSISHVVLIYK